MGFKGSLIILFDISIHTIPTILISDRTGKLIDMEAKKAIEKATSESSAMKCYQSWLEVSIFRMHLTYLYTVTVIYAPYVWFIAVAMHLGTTSKEREERYFKQFGWLWQEFGKYNWPYIIF